jgi:hypothetical protein
VLAGVLVDASLTADRTGFIALAHVAAVLEQGGYVANGCRTSTCRRSPPAGPATGRLHSPSGSSCGLKRWRA